MTSRRYDLTDEQWDKIKHSFGSGQEKRPTTSRFIGSLWSVKCGLQYFSKWQEQDLLEKIFEELALDCNLQDVSIDSTTIVKAHKDTRSKKELIGKSRGDLTTKIHNLAASPLTAINFSLSSRVANDSPQGMRCARLQWNWVMNP